MSDLRAPDPMMPHEYQPSDGPDSPCAVCGMAPDAPMHQQQNSARAQLLRGTSERRGISEFELRDGSNGNLHFTGYAAVWDQPYTVTDRFGEFTEIVERNALKRTLSRNPDVILNINHDGLPLARTTSGTLRIGTDTHGYTVEADLDPAAPLVQLIRSPLERGDITDMSWAFRVTVDDWTETDTGETRVIREVNVDGGDVSIVTTGANRGTTANPLRSALDALTNFDDLLVECRGKDGHVNLDELRSARTNVDRLIRELTPRKTLSVRAAERTLELD